MVSASTAAASSTTSSTQSSTSVTVSNSQSTPIVSPNVVASLEEQHKLHILNAIDKLRERKARPDVDRITALVYRQHKLQRAATASCLERLVDQGVVVRVEYKGSVSYRNAAKWKRSSLSGSVLNSSVTSRRLADALRALASDREPEMQEIGFTFEEIEEALVRQPTPVLERNHSVTEEGDSDSSGSGGSEGELRGDILRRALERESTAGGFVRLPGNRFALDEDGSRRQSMAEHMAKRASKPLKKDTTPAVAGLKPIAPAPPMPPLPLSAKTSPNTPSTTQQLPPVCPLPPAPPLPSLPAPLPPPPPHMPRATSSQPSLHQQHVPPPPPLPYVPPPPVTCSLAQPQPTPAHNPLPCSSYAITSSVATSSTSHHISSTAAPTHSSSSTSSAPKRGRPPGSGKKKGDSATTTSSTSTSTLTTSSSSISTVVTNSSQSNTGSTSSGGQNLTTTTTTSSSGSGISAKRPRLSTSSVPRLPPTPQAPPVAHSSPIESALVASYRCDFCLSCTAPLLVCKDCTAKAHPACMNYTPELAARAQMSPWQCSECKTCCVCEDPGDPEMMLICDACDKGYHTSCHNPPIPENKKPATEDKWICTRCREDPWSPGRRASGAVSSTNSKIAAKDEEEEEPDATDWGVEEAARWLENQGFVVAARAFREQEVDGASLLLMKRMDVLTGLGLKLGPAVKVYDRIRRLQARGRAVLACD